MQVSHRSGRMLLGRPLIRCVGAGVALSAVIVFSACSGGSQSDGSGVDEPAPQPPDDTAVVPTAPPMDVEEPAAPADTTEPDPAPPLSEPVLPSGGLRRLTAAQYRAAMLDLLGVAVPADAALPADETNETEFEFRDIGATRVSTTGLSVFQYHELAKELVAEGFAPERREELVGCAPGSADDACAQSFIEKFGRRAFRRPLVPDEASQLQELSRAAAAEYEDPWRGVQAVGVALLSSPWFLYRAEIGEPDPEQSGRRMLNPFELATRLSFLITGRIPDEALLDAAAASAAPGDFLAPQAERLLADSSAEEQAKRFFGEWLAFEQLDGLLREQELFPKFTSTIGAAMREELERLVVDQIFVQEASVIDLFTRGDSFVNPELAGLYGTPEAADADWQAVTWDDASQRAGLLTTAGWLAATARINETSPVIRGHFIVERILCRKIPPPPPGAEVMIPAPDGMPETARQRFERHSTDPACAGCHMLMDPLGFAFENFDALGEYRETDQNMPIDATGVFDGAAFDGPVEVAQLIASNPSTSACVVRQLLRVATANQLVGAPGRHAVEELHDQFVSSGFDFQQLLRDIVANDAFRYIGEIR